jgi:zinc transport system ATP-binding protein
MTAEASAPTPAPRDDVLLAARALVVGHGRTAILPPVDFAVRRGKLWGVVGRNGAGKTTLFRTLLGLHAPVSGSVHRPPGVALGYVPQRHVLDPLVPARAADLIAEGAERGRSFLVPWLGAEAKARVARAIAATRTEPLLAKRYRDLSEGEKQRVLLARALAGAPDLLVLDEPTSAMDIVAEREATDVLTRLRDELDLGVLLVTHHLGLVSQVADRLLFLDADDGVALAGSTDDVLANPLFARRYGAVLGEPEASRWPSSRPPPAVDGGRTPEGRA